MKKNKKPKFTLASAQFRTMKKDILLDVVIDDKVVEDYPVGWVEIRGAEDPVYLKRITPSLMEYHDLIEQKQKEIKASEDTEEIRKCTEELTKHLTDLLHNTVVEAIVDWDEEFFGTKFSYEAARKLFEDPSNNTVYNQMAEFIKDRKAFLPIASK